MGNEYVDMYLYAFEIDQSSPTGLNHLRINTNNLVPKINTGCKNPNWQEAGSS